MKKEKKRNNKKNKYRRKEVAEGKNVRTDKNKKIKNKKEEIKQEGKGNE